MAVSLDPGLIGSSLKICACLFVFLWVRATFPRYRYDQLMRLGWKVFLPLSLLWLVLTAGALMAFGWLPQCLNFRTASERSPDMAFIDRTARSLLLGELVAGMALTLRYFFKPQGDDQLPVRKGPDQPALQGRARAAPLSERRGTLHRLQAVRGDLPGAGDHDRGRTARRRLAPHHAL